jgi:hypothetical protein
MPTARAKLSTSADAERQLKGFIVKFGPAHQTLTPELLGPILVS